MFDLERAISAWRRAYERDRVFSAEDVEELERHLRDHTADLVQRGRTEEEAFAEALRRVGDYGSTETEYRKVFHDKFRHRHGAGHELIWTFAMLKNHLLIALRHLRRHPGYTFINLFGLAVGVACCLLIGLYMEDELSYDRFHENAERLVVMGGEMGLANGKANPSTATPYPLATFLETSIPEVEAAVRTTSRPDLPVIREETQQNTDRHVLFADPDFLQVFTFPLIAGDPRSVLASPDGAVITERLRRAYFGDEDPIGKTLDIRDGDKTYTVTVRGIAMDPPSNSTIRFDLIASVNLLDASLREENGWNWFMYTTYALLKKDTAIEAFNATVADALGRHFGRQERSPAPPEGKVPDSAVPGQDMRVDSARTDAGAPPLIRKRPEDPTPPLPRIAGVELPAPLGPAGPLPAAGGGRMMSRIAPTAPTFYGVPLTAYYLSELNEAEGFSGQKQYLYIFGSVALFVLLIAAINYVNLVTAQATRRAREVGVRKAIGAPRSQLMRQFLSESALMSTAAVLLALPLTALALPAFNLLFGKTLELSVSDHTAVLVLLPVGTLIVALLSGAYPAFVLSRFDPVKALRGTAATGRSGRGSLLRQGLVVLQFTISVTLIIGTAVIYRQLDYVQGKNLGFDGEQVVLFDLPNTIAESLKDPLKQAALSDAGVIHATVASAIPGRFRMRFGAPTEALAPQSESDQEMISLAPASVDYEFIPTLGLKVIAGRAFSRDFPADETRSYILNETAVNTLGWTPEEAIGKTFSGASGEGEIIGVVEDFHITSLHEAIEPVVLSIGASSTMRRPYVFAAKLAPDRIREAVAHIEEQFGRLAPGEPFEYTFLDDTFDAMYRSEQQLSRIFAAFAGLAILIACLGLFGLAAYTSEQRRKEIGIRKVMGASSANILALLSKDFIRLVLIAFAVAAPLAYFAMSRWLEDFAYRISIGPGIFVASGVAALLIAIATVSYQAFKAAMTNSVESLRYE